MNKTEFIARVAEVAELTKVDARKAVEAFASIVAAELKKGEKITLLGFGTFSVMRSLLVRVSILRRRRRFISLLARL